MLRPCHNDPKLYRPGIIGAGAPLRHRPAAVNSTASAATAEMNIYVCIIPPLRFSRAERRALAATAAGVACCEGTDGV